MLSKESLLARLRELEFDGFETLTGVEENPSVQMKTFEQLCEFANIKNLSTLFYHFDYVSAENFEITEEILDKLRIDEETIDVLSAEIKKYNRAVQKLDFSKPYVLTVYCIYQGFMLYSVEEDFWFENLGLDRPRIIVERMVNEYEETIEKKMEETESLRAEKLEELQDRIMQDEKFQNCTNQKLRRLYMQRLLNEDNQVRELFYSSRYGLYDIRPDDFLEEVWRDYKASL